MLREARVFLLNVAVFGRKNINKVPTPSLNGKTLIEYVAAAVLATCFLWPEDDRLAIIIKMNNQHPGRLEGLEKPLPEKETEVLLSKFLYKISMATMMEINDEQFDSLVTNITNTCFYPPR